MSPKLAHTKVTGHLNEFFPALCFMQCKKCPFISDWGFQTESEMTSTLLANSHEAMEYVLAGVAFTNMPDDGTSMPTGGIAYKLRFPSLWRQVVAGFNDWKTKSGVSHRAGPRTQRGKG